MSANPTPRALRAHALRHPNTEEGVACAGTALEKHTVKAGKKAFLFVGRKDAMMKLDASLAEAKQLAKGDTTRMKIGANGWVTVQLEGASLALLRRWIDESHALFAEGESKPRKPAPAKKKTANKKTGGAAAARPSRRLRPA